MDELRNDEMEMQDEELERYGVWVKAGPEEVVEADDDYSLSDLSEDVDVGGDEPSAESIDQADSTADSTAGSTGDDMDLPALDEFDDISLDDLDFGEGDDIDTADSPAPLAADQPPTLGDPTDELTIGVPDEAEPESTGFGESSEFVEPEPADSGAAEVAPKLDEPDESADSATSTEPDEEDLISLDDFDLEVPDEDPDPFQSLPEESDSAAPPDDDFNLDELEEELPDDFEELELDTEDSLGPDEPVDNDEFDSSIPGSDGELDDLSVDDISVDDSSEELPELEVDSIDDAEHDFTPEDQGIEIERVNPSNTISPDEEEFLSDESDLQNESESAIPASMDLQEREAFERIQTELTDIKQELAELKAALRGAGTSAPDQPLPTEESAPADSGFDAPPAEIEDEAEPEEFSEGSHASEGVQPGPGFFEEEEDETIALTGDELDNILNTAEFTEQAGEAVELEDDFIVEPEPPATEEDEDVTDVDMGLDEELEESAEAESTEEEPIEADDGAVDTDASEDDDDVASIELEPVARDTVVIEGDDSAVDELAEMDIDSELADIDSLEDETEDAGDDLEIDIDELDDVDTSGVLDESAHQAAEESAAEMDQQALESGDDDSDSDDLEDFGDLEIDDLDLDEGVEPEAAELATEDTAVEDTLPEDTPAEETSADDGDFDEFAAAVEEDIASGSGEQGVQLDEQFDQEPVTETEPETIDLEHDDDGEIEIDLDDIDGLDEFEEDSHHDAPVSEAPLPETPEPETPEPEEASSEHEYDSQAAQSAASISDLPDDLKQEIRSVLSYMDQLLEALPDDKIEEFAHSEHFEVYKRLFEELGLET